MKVELSINKCKAMIVNNTEQDGEGNRYKKAETRNNNSIRITRQLILAEDGNLDLDIANRTYESTKNIMH